MIMDAESLTDFDRDAVVFLVRRQVCRVDDGAVGEDLSEFSSDNLVLLSTLSTHLLSTRQLLTTFVSR